MSSDSDIVSSAERTIVTAGHKMAVAAAVTFSLDVEKAALS